jgi:hypothetical protein
LLQVPSHLARKSSIFQTWVKHKGMSSITFLARTLDSTPPERAYTGTPAAGVGQ